MPDDLNYTPIIPGLPRILPPMPVAPMPVAPADVPPQPAPKPTGIGAKVGGIFATLLGIKHAENVDRRTAYDKAATHIWDQAVAQDLPDDLVNASIDLFRKAWGDDAADMLKLHAKHRKEAQAYMDGIRRRQALLAQSQEPQGPPAIPTTPQPQSQPQLIQTQPQTQLAQPAQVMPRGAPGGPPIPGANFTPIRPPGLPAPPFSQGGVQAGPPPNPANPPVGRAQSAQGTGAGFGGVTTTPAELPPEFDPSLQGNLFRYGPVERGRRQAAEMRPGLEMQGQVAREQAALNYQAAYDRYKNEPWFKAMPAQLQAELLTGAHLSAVPHFNLGGLTTADEQDRDIRGNPVAVGTPGVRTMVNNNVVFTPRETRKVLKTFTKPDGTTGVRTFDPYTQKVGEEIPELAGATKLTLEKITKPDGRQLLVAVNPVTGKRGAEIDPDLVGVDPRMLATMSTTDRLHVEPQLDGTLQAIPFIDTSVSRKVPPGAAGPAATPVGPVSPGAAPTTPVRTPAAGAGTPSAQNRVGTPITVGGKGLTQQQLETSEKHLGAMDNTIDILKRVQKNLGLVSSVISAKKIEYQTDPDTGFLKAVRNRFIPMTPEEEDLAADLISASEHINVLRDPLGATGFRGIDAFQKLLAQGGNIMARPEVTRRVLENSLTALNTQREILSRYIERSRPKDKENGLTPPPLVIDLGPGRQITIPTRKR
jgi:hypothetical protein